MNKKKYPFADRLLHRLALAWPVVGKVAFDLDGFFAPHAKSALGGRHVFVSGLARAGTTILMRTFFETKQFRSLTYRDMPFVLMPHLWARVAAPFYRQQDAQERAHGDGVLVDFDSPEALEEVFWRTFAGPKYIGEQDLHADSIDNEVIENFRTYIARIAAEGHGAYLSKNNNNILRLSAIRQAFPDALIVIPFRSPLQHAGSLLNQHVHFCQMQKGDRFVRDYMVWLGHHEFGLTHKPFRFGAFPASGRFDENNINYWLEIWIDVYQYLLNTEPVSSQFVCYEALCATPDPVLTQLFHRAALPVSAAAFAGSFRQAQEHLFTDVDGSLLEKAQTIYDQLCRRTQEGVTQ